SMKSFHRRPFKPILSDWIIRHAPALNGNCLVYHVAMLLLSVLNSNKIYKDMQRSSMVSMHTMDIQKCNFSSQCQYYYTSWTASSHYWVDEHYSVHLPPICPPFVNRQPGKSKNNRIQGATEGGDRANRVFHCSNCNKTGHSSRMC